MRVIYVLGSLAGSALIYIAVAACSAADDAGGGGETSGDAPEASGGGASSENGALGILRHMIAPVGDAQAAPPEVVVRPCDIVINTLTYAEATFPGRSVEELAQVEVLRHSTDGIGPPGYEHAKSISFGGGSIFVKDGAVMVWCGSTTSGPQVDEAIFVLPGE